MKIMKAAAKWQWHGSKHGMWRWHNEMAKENNRNNEIQ